MEIEIFSRKNVSFVKLSTWDLPRRQTRCQVKEGIYEQVKAEESLTAGTTLVRALPYYGRLRTSLIATYALHSRRPHIFRLRTEFLAPRELYINGPWHPCKSLPPFDFAFSLQISISHTLHSRHGARYFWKRSRMEEDSVRNL